MKLAQCMLELQVVSSVIFEGHIYIFLYIIPGKKHSYYAAQSNCTTSQSESYFTKIFDIIYTC